jgi:RHS repeat-associated protein
LGEYTGTGTLIQETIWMGDTPVATLLPNGSGISIYYVHTDHLGTPRKITRPSDNGLMWRWDPDTFGSVAPNSNPTGLGTFTYNLRFPGQYSLNESGLYYNYYRDYDPSTGRYIESDPIGLRGGINPYAYVHGNPISRVDPLGLDDSICMFNHSMCGQPLPVTDFANSNAAAIDAIKNINPTSIAQNTEYAGRIYQSWFGFGPYCRQTKVLSIDPTRGHVRFTERTEASTTRTAGMIHDMTTIIFLPPTNQLPTARINRFTLELRLET